MSAREELLAAIDGTHGAPIPCSFMIFRALRNACRDEYEFTSRQLEMGLNARIRLEDLPVRFAPEVSIADRIEPGPPGEPPLLHRTYETPAGTLTSTIKQAEGWTYGDSLPIFGDYITPRAVKPPITGPADLDALRFLLTPPREDDVRAFTEDAAKRKQFADDRGVALAAGWHGERAPLLRTSPWSATTTAPDA